VIAHKVVVGGYDHRARDGELTGEWIVYTCADGQNYYLTLGIHTEGDEAIQVRVIRACEEFPELAETAARLKAMTERV
jgi:hypothetical protein